MDEPRSHPVDVLPDGTEVVFKKPGKEANPNRKNPKPQDMTPLVSGYDRASFLQTWVPLAKVASADWMAFKVLAVLIYRNAFHMDHDMTRQGLRYRPSATVRSCITALDKRTGSLLPGKSVWNLLHFLDVLGWNEDVKYHFIDGGTDFENRSRFAVGRVNTLLSTIRVPAEVTQFARHAAENVSSPDLVKFDQIIALMQDLIRTRGVCPPTDRQLLEWFTPYLRE